MDDNIEGRARVEDTPELQAYYADIAKLDASALWTVANVIEPWEPKSSSLPMLWRYRDLRPHVLRALDLEEFAERLYGPGTPVRLRPSYFPFVEPGAEVDIACVFCKQPDGTRSGCSICKHTGYIEVLGCGMIHPVVFENCGIDPEAWSGFALGMGLERLAMLRYGIPNIKLMFDNDPRFLAQF